MDGIELITEPGTSREVDMETVAARVRASESSGRCGRPSTGYSVRGAH